MGNSAKNLRNAKVKCITCNTPVVETVDERYICVSCGTEPINKIDRDQASD